MPYRIVRNHDTQLNTSKYQSMDGKCGDEESLRSCYRQCLQSAKEQGRDAIAFPLIYTDGFDYPKEEGMRIAMDEINEFLLQSDMDISLIVLDDETKVQGENRYLDLESYIRCHYAPRPMAMAMPSASAMNSEPVAEKHSFFDSIFKRTAKAAMKEEAVQVEMDCEDVQEFAHEEMCAEPMLAFDEQHESKLEERMRHMTDTYSEYLMYLIQEKHMENAEVYKRAIVDKKIFSKIKNHAEYHPNKLTALCLCVGAKLNLDESKDLLARAGYALSPCDKTDIIFSYFIENEIYDMIELDIQLEEHGLPCIIS